MKKTETKVDRDCVLLGGILKYKDVGYGFKVVMKDIEKTRWYKDMFKFILNDDGFLVEFQKGLYDKKE